MLSLSYFHVQLASHIYIRRLLKPGLTKTSDFVGKFDVLLHVDDLDELLLTNVQYTTLKLSCLSNQQDTLGEWCVSVTTTSLNLISRFGLQTMFTALSLDFILVLFHSNATMTDGDSATY